MERTLTASSSVLDMSMSTFWESMSPSISPSSGISPPYTSCSSSSMSPLGRERPPSSLPRPRRPPPTPLRRRSSESPSFRRAATAPRRRSSDSPLERGASQASESNELPPPTPPLTGPILAHYSSKGPHDKSCTVGPAQLPSAENIAPTYYGPLASCNDEKTPHPGRVTHF